MKGGLLVPHRLPDSWGSQVEQEVDLLGALESTFPSHQWMHLADGLCSESSLYGVHKASTLPVCRSNYTTRQALPPRSGNKPLSPPLRQELGERAPPQPCPAVLSIITSW